MQIAQNKLILPRIRSGCRREKWCKHEYGMCYNCNLHAARKAGPHDVFQRYPILLTFLVATGRHKLVFFPEDASSHCRTKLFYKQENEKWRLFWGATFSRLESKKGCLVTFHGLATIILLRQGKAFSCNHPLNPFLGPFLGCEKILVVKNLLCSWKYNVTFFGQISRLCP